MSKLGTNKKTRIFIADDERWYLEGVKDALESEGYEVIIESRMTGTRAIEIMRDPGSQIDILILDIMMDPGPELAKILDNGTRTGVVVCKIIREEFPDVPIICLTVVNDESIINQMVNMGCKVLRKTEVGIREILEAVRIAEKS